MSAAGAASAPQRLLGTLLLAVLLSALPPSAWAQPEFPVSCENVTGIRIMRFESERWEKTMGMPSENGYFYYFNMRLNEESTAALIALRNATPHENISYNGWTCSYRNIRITVNGEPLISSAPVWNVYNGLGILLPFVRKEDALEAARRVCPTLTPQFSEGWSVQ